MRRHSCAKPIAVLALLAVFLLPAGQATAQQAGAADENSVFAVEDYITPPADILAAAFAPRWENLNLGSPNPSGEWFLNTLREGFPALAQYAKTSYDLGQFQVDPAANRHRSLSRLDEYAYELISVDGQTRRAIEVPEGARVSGASWSPDGSQLAFYVHTDDATHIYVADPSDGDSRQITRTPVLAMNVRSLQWTADGEHIVTVLLPEDRGAEPAEPEVPETPRVRVTTPDRNRLRTYFDLLENEYEKDLVRYFSTGQLARIEVDSRDVENIGEPAMIESISTSPDGMYFRVTTMKDEFSYIVPTSSAGSVEEVWDAEGEVLTELDDSDLNESVITPGGGGGRGGRGGANANGNNRRQMSWRSDGGPGFIYLQRVPDPDGDDAADAAGRGGRGGGFAGRGGGQGGGGQADRPDRVMHWLPPFDSTSVETVYESPTAIGSIRFDETNGKMFISRSDDGTQTVHMVDLESPGEEVLVSEYSPPEGEDDEEDPEDHSGFPGSLMGVSGGGGGGRGGGGGGGGKVRVSSAGQHVYFQGTETFEDDAVNAPRPWVDRVEIGTGARERIWRSAANVYETFSSALDDDLNQIIIRRQSASMVPQDLLVDRAGGGETQITQNVDHTPELTAARRESFFIVRPDGFRSRVRVTLPHDFVDGQDPLPAMFWFYPREYSEQEQYDRGLSSVNINQFQNISVRDVDILTLRGYAIVEPDVPIVGPEDQRNDEYVHDLRNTLAAVIDSVSARGWVDRDRLGIGGHSYGAFSTAHAMIQTPFFKAGIAGDGNFNRTLTPAGFQSEGRDLWEAQDLYIEMSPFFQVDRLTGALLIYHGMDDHNVGTNPLHGERMFHAMEVLGKTAALYMYPYEDHGPATLETNMDMWARWIEWLDTYVKNADKKIVSEQEAPLLGGG